MMLNLLLASAEHIDPHTLHAAEEVVHEAAHQMSFMEYIFHSNVINFAIVVGLLVYLFKKYRILDAIPNKQQLIVDKIEHSEKIKKEAQDEYNDTQEKLQNVDTESKEIVDNGKDVSLSLVQQIETETEQAKATLEEKTIKIIESEKQQVANEITEEISKAAVCIAKDHIKKSINDEMHHKFINEFIDNLDNVKVKK